MIRFARPKLKETLPNGQSTIYFNNRIKFPGNFIDVVEQGKRKAGELRSLTKNYIEVTFEPGDPETSSTSVGFDWGIKSYDSQEIGFQFEFENPLQVSQGEIRDSILIKLYLSDLKTEDGSLLLEEETIKMTLPR